MYKKKKPFAIVFVVNREMPSSGKPGDKAVITSDGKITGWIGGGCIKGIALKEALKAIEDGKPRLIRISATEPTDPKPGVTYYPMSGHSGGAVELYIEPILPKPHLVIMGKSNVAMALSRLGRAMDYPVVVIAQNADKAGFPDADRIEENGLDPKSLGENNCVVVCTQGEDDADALEQALYSGADYVSFVSSPRRANGIFQILRDRGAGIDDLKKIKTPAGLDINAKLPEEVAVSILAEIIAYFRREEEAEKTAGLMAAHQLESDLYINPVCNIPVQKSTAKHILEYGGKTIYFCCDGCKVSFEKAPDQYVK